MILDFLDIDIGESMKIYVDNIGAYTYQTTRLVD
jgi:hypothetical protein